MVRKFVLSVFFNYAKYLAKLRQISRLVTRGLFYFRLPVPGWELRFTSCGSVIIVSSRKIPFFRKTGMCRMLITVNDMVGKNLPVCHQVRRYAHNISVAPIALINDCKQKSVRTLPVLLVNAVPYFH